MVLPLQEVAVKPLKFKIQNSKLRIEIATSD